MGCHQLLIHVDDDCILRWSEIIDIRWEIIRTFDVIAIYSLPPLKIIDWELLVSHLPAHSQRASPLAGRCQPATRVSMFIFAAVECAMLRRLICTMDYIPLSGIFASDSLMADFGVNWCRLFLCRGPRQRLVETGAAAGSSRRRVSTALALNYFGHASMILYYVAIIR